MPLGLNKPVTDVAQQPAPHSLGPLGIADPQEASPAAMLSIPPIARSRYFVAVGPQKTATTWLHRQLEHHPDVELPKKTKELFFWDRNYNLGPEWLLSHFSRKGRVWGEISPSYYDRLEAIERLAASGLNPLVIVTLRHPVERCWSHYLHERKKGRAPKDFALCCQANPAIVACSHYARLTSAWLQAFPESVLIVLMDDIRENPGEVLQSVCSFLNVKQLLPGAVLDEVVNQATLARNSRLARSLNRISHALRRMRLYSLVNFCRALLGPVVYRRADSAELVLPDEIRQQLLLEFAEDVTYVERLLRRKLPEWRR